MLIYWDQQHGQAKQSGFRKLGIYRVYAQYIPSIYFKWYTRYIQHIIMSYILYGYTTYVNIYTVYIISVISSLLDVHGIYSVYTKQASISVILVRTEYTWNILCIFQVYTSYQGCRWLQDERWRTIWYHTRFPAMISYSISMQISHDWLLYPGHRPIISQLVDIIHDIIEKKSWNHTRSMISQSHIDK